MSTIKHWEVEDGTVQNRVLFSFTTVTWSFIIFLQIKLSLLLVFLSDAANYPQAHGSTVVALHLVVFRVSRFHRERRCFET